MKLDIKKQVISINTYVQLFDRSIIKLFSLHLFQEISSTDSMAIQQTFMHFHRLFCLSTLLFLARFGNAQENLIKNPSFEIHSQTPLSLGHYNFCTNNWNPYIFSSDYYSTEIPSTCSNFIPNNNFGNQICNDGEYYVGISLNGWNYFNSNYQPFRSDFVGGILSQELQKNKVYQFQFFISKAEKGIFKTNADLNYFNSNYQPFRSDFVGGILSQELQKNKVYQFQFFISKAEKGIFKTNAID